MTNSEKAKERAMQVFPCPNESEQRRIVELAYNDACNWKEREFRKYLEKKKKDLTDIAISNSDQDTVEANWGKVDCVDEIINELFGGERL